MKTRFATLFISFILLVSGISTAQTFTSYTTANGLPDNNVLDLAVDGNNVKWFATQNGVARLSGTTWTVYTTADGLVDNYINCIAVDKDNHVWAGTDLGVSYYNGTTWVTYTMANGLIDDFISCIAAANDGNVWIGTNSGVSKFDGTTFTNFNTSSGLPWNMVSYITVDNSTNNVWIGTWIGGLCMYNGSTFEYFTSLNGLPDDNITTIAIDNAGNKYIGTFSGIGVLNISNVYVRTFTSGDGMLNNFAKDIAVDSHSQLWAALYADYIQEGGISWYNSSTWNNLTVQDGLVDYLVKRIKVDKNDHVWIATGNGVSEYNPGTTGLNETALGAGSVYPNPAKDQLTINYKNNDAMVSVIDAMGRMFLSGSMSPETSCLNISSLKPGIYFVQINDNGKLLRSKLIVQ